MKKIALIITFSFTLISLNAQEETFRQSFVEANTLMEENQYNVALPIWLKLQAEQPANFNVNYKVGVCYINSANDKNKALSFLVIAVQNTTKNYDPFSSSEKKSPVESYFYLARAYHISYELDNAMVNYNSFKEKISKKHYLFSEVDHHIEQCKNAKVAIENPVNIKVSNMGDLVNSPAGDYSPVLSIDESTIYFTSRRVRNDSSNYYIKDISDGKHYEDIYVSHNYDGVWTEPELLGINTEGHEATVNISTDGQTLFIYKDDNGDGNIYISKLEDDEWSIPVKLGSDVNLESRETHAHISPDENFLYFVSDRKKGFGGQDIYVCKKLPNGEWAKAQNIGDVINTPYDEDGVFIHPDGKTMYFSSKGHTSIGGYDIFYSVKDDAGNWSKPKNMGYPVNSTDNDVFFVTSADGKRGYYSSFQEKGYGEKDIYKISLEDADAIPLTLLTAYIKIAGLEGYPADATITVTNNETDEREKIHRPRKKDGKFVIILEPGNDYHIVYAAAGFTQEEDLYIPPISSYQEINRGINLDDVVFGNPGDNNTTVNNNNTSTDNKDPKDPKWNYKENAELDKLKAVINTLKLQIEELKEQLANSLKNNPNANNSTNDSRVSALEAIIDDLKKQIESIPTNNNSNNVNTNYTASGNVVASYQEYFNYNVKSVNTASSKYKDMVNKAVAKSKSAGKVTVEIESSASHVPTKTYGTNSNLASKRANDAKESIIKSLVNKGVKKGNIIISNVNSNVSGPKYNSDFNNTSIYEKYQYVIIKVK